MGSQYPAEFLGLGRRMGRIAPGCRADLVLLDDDAQVLETWIGGETAAMAEQPRKGASHA
jgi:N-acetylglucosamine-6-phosphate deacetylase